MYAKFPLFQSHLDLAHQYWEQVLKPGGAAVDATCGNGHDTLFLAPLVLTPDSGALFALDIQQNALDRTKERLLSHLDSNIVERVQYIQGCHSQFPEQIAPKSLDLIVYNLGYLPESSKALTTIRETTLESLNLALEMIKPGGLISITCYPGHPEGAREEEAIETWSQHLSPQHWSCCYHQWKNRQRSPSLFILQSKIQ